MNLIPRFQTWLQVLCNDLSDYPPFYVALVLLTYGMFRMGRAYHLYDAWAWMVKKGF